MFRSQGGAVRRRLAAVGVAVGMAVAAAAAPAAPAAAAVPGLVRVTASTAFDSTVYKAVRVFCPNGLRVVGLGYDLFGAEGSVVLDDFIPSANNVLVGAGEVVGPGEPSDGTTASWKVEATAVCANPVPGYTIVNATSQFRPDKGKSRLVKATCPAGTFAIGHGGSLDQGFGQVSLEDMQMDATEAFARGAPDEDGYSGSWAVTAYAICASGGLTGVQIVNQFTDAQNSDTFQSALALCPAGKQAIGGGWSVTQGFNANEILNIGLTVFTGDASGVGALASEDADGYSPSWGMLSQAVCVNS